MPNDQTAVAKREAAPSDKVPIKAGGPVAGIIPADVDQAYRLSQALAQAGDMVPQHFQGQPQKIMGAIMRGAEVGLAPMQALSSIAVINGRATLWGDSLPALVFRAGHHIDVEIQGEGKSAVATATLTRAGGKKVVRSFSWSQARQAGLTDKKGPWQQYPERMLMMRARSWAIRDGAPEVLMGLGVADEVMDHHGPEYAKDVTPEPRPSRRGGISIAPAPEPEPVIEPEATAEEADDAEVVSALDVDPNRGAPGSEAWDRGIADHRAGKPYSANPYEAGTSDADDWAGAWAGSEKANEGADA